MVIGRAVWLTASAWLSLAMADEQPTDTEWRWLTLSVNGQTQRAPFKLLYKKEQLYIQSADLAKLRLKANSAQPLQLGDSRFYSLTKLNGVSMEFNKQRQHVDLKAEPAAFNVYQTSYQHKRTEPDQYTGVYLNYDVQTQHSDALQSQAALLQFTAFSGTANFTHRSVYNNANASSLLRLESVFIFDQPDKTSRLYLGDSINEPGSWGRAVQFAGIRYASEFSLHPGFITYPLPSIQGEAALPSSVDILINNVSQHQQNVPPGPFELQQFPTVTGSGEMQLQVTDLLGRTETYVQPFYIASQLLAPGLTAFSYEAGWIRENYGLVSNDYGQPFISGTYRRGLNNTLTAELRSELSDNHAAAGTSVSVLLADYAVAELSLAGSKTDQATGLLLRTGLSRQSPAFSFSFYAAYADKTFRTLGQPLSQARLHNEFGISAGTQIFDTGNLTAAVIHRKQWAGEDFSLLSVNYNHRLSGTLNAAFSASKSLTNSKDYSVGLTLSLSFGQRDSGQLSIRREQQHSRKQVQLQRNLTMGDSFGYRALAESAQQNWLNSELQWQRSHGLYRANVSSYDGATAARLSASGSLIWLDDSVQRARWMANSFALVDVGEIEGVNVMLENQIVAKTNSDGKALITGLMPYDQNYLSIEHNKLPINTSVQSLQLNVTPAYYAGTVARFKLRQGQNAVITLLLPDGTPVPAGAKVRINQQISTFPVASKGKTYLEQLPYSATLHVSWRNKQCRAQLNRPATTEPLPDLGIIYCSEDLP